MKFPLPHILLMCFSITNLTFSQTEKHGVQNWSVYVSQIKPLLLVDDHVSEGFLAPLKTGKIMLLFRLDPGKEGHHTGTNGYIASIEYDQQTDSWGKIKTVYNSNQYDDRNIHGGITLDGRIVVFFRHYDGKNTVGRYFIISEDNGQTWSEPRVSKNWTIPKEEEIQWVWSTGQMFYNADIGKYSMLGKGFIINSSDGLSWDDINPIPNKKPKLNEIAGAWCSNNRIIALQRDDERKFGHPLMQLESYDNGKTWTEPVPTNIPPKKHWGAAPQLIYDQKRDLLIALNSDRYSQPDEKNSLYIYTGRPDEVFGNPQGWKLQHELLRPWATLGFNDDRPLNLHFYGYPTIAPINENEYLVVFTERAIMDGNEQADLYYFRILLK